MTGGEGRGGLVVRSGAAIFLHKKTNFCFAHSLIQFCLKNRKVVGKKKQNLRGTLGCDMLFWGRGSGYSVTKRDKGDVKKRPKSVTYFMDGPSPRLSATGRSEVGKLD